MSDNLDELERLEREATAGPWAVIYWQNPEPERTVAGVGYSDPNMPGMQPILLLPGVAVECEPRDDDTTELDLRLTAAARNALPALLRAISAGRALRDEAATPDHEHWNDWVRRLQARAADFDAALEALRV